MLDYNCIKNHCRLITVDLIRQKELDTNPKTANRIQQIEFVEELRKLDNNGSATDTDNDQFVFLFTVL